MKISLFIDNIIHLFAYFILCLVFYTIRYLSLHSKEKFKPNRFFGYRTELAFKTQQNWIILNLCFCKYMLIMLHFYILINISSTVLKYLLYDLNQEEKILVSFSSILLSLTMIFGISLVLLKMQKIEEELKKCSK